MIAMVLHNMRKWQLPPVFAPNVCVRLPSKGLESKAIWCVRLRLGRWPRDTAKQKEGPEGGEAMDSKR